MVRKRSLSSVLEENPTPTRITVRPIVQPRNRKQPCFCSNCEGMLVNSCTKSHYKLLEEISVPKVAKEDLNTQKNVDAESYQILENLKTRKNVDDETSQSNTLNEQEVSNTLNEQEVNEVWQEHASWKRESRYSSARVNFRQDLTTRESTTKEDQSDDTSDEDDEVNKDELMNNISEIFEDYLYLSFTPFQEDRKSVV